MSLENFHSKGVLFLFIAQRVRGSRGRVIFLVTRIHARQASLRVNMESHLPSSHCLIEEALDI